MRRCLVRGLVALMCGWQLRWGQSWGRALHRGAGAGSRSQWWAALNPGTPTVRGALRTRRLAGSGEPHRWCQTCGQPHRSHRGQRPRCALDLADDLDWRGSPSCGTVPAVLGRPARGGLGRNRGWSGHCPRMRRCEADLLVGRGAVGVSSGKWLFRPFRTMLWKEVTVHPHFRVGTDPPAACISRLLQGARPFSPACTYLGQLGPVESA